MRLKYVVVLALAHWTVFVSLKNIKVVSVSGLARAILGCVGAARGVEGLSYHMRQLSILWTHLSSFQCLKLIPGSVDISYVRRITLASQIHYHESHLEFQLIFPNLPPRRRRTVVA